MGKAANLRLVALAFGLLLGATALPAVGQEKALSLRGVFSTGVYSTRNRNAIDARDTSIPTTLELNVSGFIARPDFIRFGVRPLLSTGPQATEAGFLNGNGISVTTTFLSRRNFPLTLTYLNVQREELAYGSLTRVSGLRSRTHARNFGLNWRLRSPRLPTLTLDLARSRDTLEPGDPIIPDHRSHSRSSALGINDRRWGWNFDGSLRWNSSASDFANPLEPGLVTVRLDQRSSQYQFTAQRPLWRNSQVVLTGGLLSHRNKFNERPFDQDVRFVNSVLSFGTWSRWQGNLRASYNSNLLGTEIQRALGQLAGPGGTGGSGPLSVPFVPIETRISSVAVSGNLRYQVHRDWSLFGGLAQDKVNAPNGQVSAAKASSLNGRAGVSFNRRFSWASVASQYSLSAGRLSYADIPNSGVLGHAFSLMVQRGRVERLELTGSFSVSNQRVEQVIAYRTASQSAELSAARRIASFLFRGGFGMQRTSFRDGSVDYDSDGLTFQGSIEHSRVQLHYFHNVVDGTTLQPFLSNPESGSPAGAALQTLPLRLFLSSLRTRTLTLHASPWRRLEADLSWTAGHQDLDHRTNNDYDLLEARVGYRFRLLTFQVGYSRYELDFLNLPGYMRSRFYLRVARPFRVF